MPSRLHRPVSVELMAALLQLGFDYAVASEMTAAARAHRRASKWKRAALVALKLDPKAVELDHDPALGLRHRTRGGRYIPDENDPRYMTYRSSAGHYEKTNGHPKGVKGATVANGDKHKIAKGDRLAESQLEFRRKLTKPKPTKADAKTTRWPKRKLPTMRQRGA